MSEVVRENHEQHDHGNSKKEGQGNKRSQNHDEKAPLISEVVEESEKHDGQACGKNA